MHFIIETCTIACGILLAQIIGNVLGNVVEVLDRALVKAIKAIEATKKRNA